ncbi:thiamine pyrophosphate-binding protein [Saccharopolyspora sp. MS10]|uniref:thiamine pyrophosphate-binding protein n=1 Tax=Saccharopolyspora sp. MS10 TaxID=3385973 RepID=UPI0039A2AA4B
MTGERSTATGNGAELLVDALVRHGIDTVFGYPGDTGVAFYDALARRTADVRHVLVRDERHAGYMADGYARTRRRLAVCEAASGAGAVYLAGGLGESSASGIPVLVLTTDNNRRSAGTSAISEVDQELLFAAVTKWRGRAEAAAEIPGLLAEAIAAATSGRPGPAVLVLPEDVLEEPAEVPGAEPAPAPPGFPAVRRAAPEEAVARVAALLGAAERPALLAGGGVHLSGAWPQLLRLAEHAALPVATTIHGKGALDEAHPMSLGVAGSNGAREHAHAWLAGSDFALFAGTRANATDTVGFTAPPRGGPGIAHLDVDAARAGRTYPGAIPLVGDVATVLDQLRAAVPAAAEEVRARRTAELAAERRRWRRQVDAAPLPQTPPGVLRPREVVEVLRGAFGDAWVVADAGTPTPYLACHWETGGGGWRVVIPRGHGPMGYAVAAAVGVAVAHPGERVLCLTTENSVAMAVGEWETAARLGLPITYVVLDNTSMGWIKMIQHLYLGGRHFGVDPGPIDPVLLARGTGLPGARTHDLDELAGLAAAQVAGPRVLHVAVPEHHEAPPPVRPWQAALSGESTGRPIH